MTLQRRCLGLVAPALVGLALGLAAPSQAAPSGGAASVEATAMPAAKPKRALQTGPASWYGARHHGQRTASGERFDMNGLSAAHRSLPFGTELIVTNLENGRSVKVRVNDRGPHRPGFVLDLSQGAAERIGLRRAGIATVALRPA
jgi:rare lipoprotein A